MIYIKFFSPIVLEGISLIIYSSAALLCIKVATSQYKNNFSLNYNFFPPYTSSPPWSQTFFPVGTLIQFGITNIYKTKQPTTLQSCVETEWLTSGTQIQLCVSRLFMVKALKQMWILLYIMFIYISHLLDLQDNHQSVTSRDIEKT